MTQIDQLTQVQRTAVVEAVCRVVRAAITRDVENRMSVAQRPTPAALRRTAVHEAGHALAAELTGWTVAAVRIDRRTGAGACELPDPPPAPWSDIAVSLAGHAAEVALFGEVQGASPTDHDDALEYLALLGLDQESVPVLERGLSELFTHRGHRRAVAALAAVLVKRGRVPGPDVRRVLGAELDVESIGWGVGVLVKNVFALVGGGETVNVNVTLRRGR